MRVKIDNVWYDSNEVPILVEFTPQDAKNVQKLLENTQAGVKYASLPDGHPLLEYRKVLAHWMEEPPKAPATNIAEETAAKIAGILL